MAFEETVIEETPMDGEQDKDESLASHIIRAIKRASGLEQAPSPDEAAKEDSLGSHVIKSIKSTLGFGGTSPEEAAADEAAAKEHGTDAGYERTLRVLKGFGDKVGQSGIAPPAGATPPARPEGKPLGMKPSPALQQEMIKALVRSGMSEKEAAQTVLMMNR